MSHRSAILIACLASAGCLKIPDVSEPGRFKCTDDTHCLVGYACVNGTCQASGSSADTTPPALPSFVTATPADSRVTLSWKNPTDSDFAGTVVQRGTQAGSPSGPTVGTQVYRGTGTQVIDAPLTNGVSVYYSLFTYDRAGNYSAGVQVSAVPQADAGLQPVTNLSATLLGADVELSWTNPPSMASTVVRRDTSGYPSTISQGVAVNVAPGASGAVDPGLVSGKTYYYSVFAMTGAGAAATAATTQVAVPQVLAAARARRSWNVWVTADGSACAAADAVAQNACIHLGERRLFVVPGRYCTGLSASDALGVFDWACTEVGGNADIVSLGFKPGKGLADLLNTSTLTWRSNSVTVLDGSSNIIASSAFETWWDNPITGLGSAAPVPNAVHVWATMTPTDLVISYPNVTILGPGPAFPATGDPSTSSAAIVVYAPFTWIENVTVRPGGSKAGIELNNTAFPVVRNSWVAGAAYGFLLTNTNNGRLENVAATSSTYDGVYAYGSDFNALTYVSSVDNAANGLLLDDSSGNVLRHIRAAGNRIHGIYLSGSYNVVAGAVAASNANTGIDVVGNASRGNVLSVITTGNNGSAGLWMGGGGAGPVGTRVLNLAAINDGIGLGSGTDGTYLADVATSSLYIEASNNTFARVLEIADGLCVFSGAPVSPGLTPSCANAGPSSAAITLGGVDFAAAIGGKVVFDDPRNPSDNLGYANYSPDLDWIDFTTPLRAWGTDGGPFPSSDNRGACATTGNCRIWDWRVLAGDSGIGGTSPALRGVVAFPDYGTPLPHDWHALDATACAAIAGARWDVGTTTCSTIVFPDMIEVDAGGNGNGLCEWGEACLYTPNIGAYQGEGQGVYVETISGAGPGVDVYQYAVNGL